MITKICTNKDCIHKGKPLSLDNFHKQKGGKFGVKSRCKDCKKEYARKWRGNNKEYHKNWRENNKEKAKENIRKWRENNKEKIKECNRKWRENNKEKFKEYHKNYYHTVAKQKKLREREKDK